MIRRMLEQDWGYVKGTMRKHVRCNGKKRHEMYAIDEMIRKKGHEVAQVCQPKGKKRRVGIKTKKMWQGGV